MPVLVAIPAIRGTLTPIIVGAATPRFSARFIRSLTHDWLLSALPVDAAGLAAAPPELLPAQANAAGRLQEKLNTPALANIMNHGIL